MYKFISIKKASDGKHKYEVELLNEETGRKKTVKFGSEGMGDFTLFTKKKGSTLSNPSLGGLTPEEHKERYITRHQKREDWTKSGTGTAGFWSKHILWNKPTVEASLKDTLKTYF